MAIRTYALVTLLLTMALPAAAQLRPPSLPKGHLPTMSEPLDVPLKTLLDSGYAITSGMGGAGGGSFSLHNEKTGKWVACDLSPEQFGNPPASACIALN